MDWLWLVILVLVFCFAGVILFGPPYLPTLSKQIEVGLKLTKLKSGQTLLELGSGDGRVALAAAKQGIHVIGYELNPLMLLVSKIITWRYRKLVKIRWANFLRADWPPAEAVFIFGLDRIMPKLDQKIIRETKKPIRLVSVAFRIPDKKPTKISHGLFVYDYCQKSR